MPRENGTLATLPKSVLWTGFTIFLNYSRRMEQCHTSFLRKYFFIFYFFKKPLVLFHRSTHHGPRSEFVPHCETLNFPGLRAVERIVRYDIKTYMRTFNKPLSVDLNRFYFSVNFRIFSNRTIIYHIRDLQRPLKL